MYYWDRKGISLLNKTLNYIIGIQDTRIEINAHYYLHPYFNIYMHQIIKGLWRRSYPRKDSCGIGTHKVEIQPTIDLVEYGGLWPACGGGKSGGYRRDDGCGFLSPSPIGFHYHRDTYPT